MTKEKQAELIAAACKEAGLDGHIKWIEKKAHAHTWAEKIAERFRDNREMPTKSSYMYCDTLDMCFFYNEAGTPYMTYAGYVTAGCKDIAGNQLLEAFRRANHVLNIMKELAEEVQV